MLCIPFRLDPELNKLRPSEVEFKKKDLKTLGWLMLRFFSITKFIRYREYTNNDNEIMITSTNFTIINTVLCWCGPLHEATLSTILLLIQVRKNIKNVFEIILIKYILGCIRYFINIFYSLLFGEIFL
jgi:hypothetical protein